MSQPAALGFGHGQHRHVLYTARCGRMFPDASVSLLRLTPTAVREWLSSQAFPEFDTVRARTLLSATHEGTLLSAKRVWRRRGD